MRWFSFGLEPLAGGIYGSLTQRCFPVLTRLCHIVHLSLFFKKIGYAPDECGCCASAVNSSFIRTVTTSFGSICFGSFLVAILQALRALANSARENGDAQIFACIAECILGCLASILEYFNKVRHLCIFNSFLPLGWRDVVNDSNKICIALLLLLCV